METEEKKDVSTAEIGEKEKKKVLVLSLKDESEKIGVS